MLYEMQSYTLKSRSLSLVESRFGKALVERTRLSRLGAFWRSEVGILNQLIVVWPYDNLAQRNWVLDEAMDLDTWPPDISEFVIDEKSKMLVPAPFSPPLEPRALGGLYEIRTYTYPAAAIPYVINSWTEIIDERVKYSPLIAAWYSETGEIREWIHIWAYQDAAERDRIRSAVSKAGIWPISVVDQRLKREPEFVALTMQNMLVIPTRFSPLH